MPLNDGKTDHVLAPGGTITFENGVFTKRLLERNGTDFTIKLVLLLMLVRLAQEVESGGS